MIDRYVLGLDLSLTSTGVAMVHECGEVYTTAVKSPSPKGPQSIAQKATRMQRIQQEALGWAFDGWDSAVVEACAMAVIESPSPGSIGGQPHERGGLWWRFATELTEAGITVATVAPKTREVYATGHGKGKGAAGKRAVFDAVIDAYGHLVELGSNDEADAVILAAMGARQMGWPVDDPLPAEKLRAMASAKWPA